MGDGLPGDALVSAFLRDTVLSSAVPVMQDAPVVHAVQAATRGPYPKETFMSARSHVTTGNGLFGLLPPCRQVTSSYGWRPPQSHVAEGAYLALPLREAGDQL